MNKISGTNTKGCRGLTGFPFYGICLFQPKCWAPATYGVRAELKLQLATEYLKDVTRLRPDVLDHHPSQTTLLYPNVRFLVLGGTRRLSWGSVAREGEGRKMQRR